jgi:hypothetical protein
MASHVREFTRFSIMWTGVPLLFSEFMKHERSSLKEETKQHTHKDHK